MWKEVEGKEPLLLTRSSDGGAVGGDKPKADENNGLLRATYRRVFVERRAVALLFVFHSFICVHFCVGTLGQITRVSFDKGLRNVSLTATAAKLVRSRDCVGEAKKSAEGDLRH